LGGINSRDPARKRQLVVKGYKFASREGREQYKEGAVKRKEAGADGRRQQTKTRRSEFVLPPLPPTPAFFLFAVPASCLTRPSNQLLDNAWLAMVSKYLLWQP